MSRMILNVMFAITIRTVGRLGESRRSTENFGQQDLKQAERPILRIREIEILLTSRILT